VSPAFVADASVGIAWAVPTQSSPAAERLLDEVALGRPFVIPALWPFEVANSLLVLKRRKKLTGEQYALARRALSSLRPVVDDEGPRVALGRISEIAEENGLSVYDAAYLELSLRKNLPLASRDTDLNRAAKRRGLATLL
jgi:predicted nucleic acid-binding protein